LYEHKFLLFFVLTRPSSSPVGHQRARPEGGAVQVHHLLVVARQVVVHLVLPVQAAVSTMRRTTFTPTPHRFAVCRSDFSSRLAVELGVLLHDPRADHVGVLVAEGLSRELVGVHPTVAEELGHPVELAA
jgi:hypothetical protein